MVMIKNAAPKAVLTGFKDESGRALPVVPEAIPQHLPLIYLQTERGPMDPQLVGGSDMLKMYGAKSFEERSKYFSHATMGATTCNGNGNLVMVKRVVEATAAPANMVLCLEVVEEQIEAYVRNPDGSVQRDVSNLKITDPDDIRTGRRLRWCISELGDVNNLRGESIKVGTMLNGAGVAGTKYPIMAFRMGIGAYGNNVGLRLSYPGPATADPTDASVIESARAMVYRAQFVEREDVYTLPRITSSMFAERAIDFALKPGVVNPKTDKDLDAYRILNEYQDVDPSTGRIPRYAPIDAMYIYNDNIDTVLAELYGIEVGMGITIEDQAMINIFDGLDVQGHDHYSFILDGSSLTLNENTTIYALGGNDGVVSEATLDALVADECLYNWENINYPLVDSARYPFSIVYDTGFTINTKKAIIGTMGYRKDISVTACTQDVLEVDNSISAETSIMTALRAYARLIPESTLWGTPVTRCVVWDKLVINCTLSIFVVYHWYMTLSVSVLSTWVLVMVSTRISLHMMWLLPTV